MKRTLLSVLTLLPLAAHAGKITMQLTEQTETTTGGAVPLFQFHLRFCLQNEQQALPQCEDV